MSRPRSRFGAAKVELKLPNRIPMAGYSILARKGRMPSNPAPEQRLHARALFFQDESDRAVVICTVDLMSASLYLFQRVVDITRSSRYKLDSHQIILAGTHTHTAPGHFFGNRVYDCHATNDALRGFDEKLADSMAERIADAIMEAASKAIPARISFPEPEILWGITRNRSLEAFLQNEEASNWNEPGMPGHCTLDLTASQRAIDPRLRVISAWDADDKLLGAFATFGAHNTAIGYKRPFYDPDWVGRATHHAETSLSHERGRPVIAIALTGAADVSPLPAVDRNSYYGPREQGPELARFVGLRVGNGIIHACNRDTTRQEIELDIWHESWEPARYFNGSVDGHDPLPPLSPYQFGAATLGGAQDGRTALHVLAPEGWPGNRYQSDHPQYPKRPAMGPIYRVWAKLRKLALAPYHPLHVLRINQHYFATIPGEPTTITAYRIERALQTLPTCSAGSVIGYSGDYAGYFTTQSEYLLQYYEGSSSLYGRHTGQHLQARLLRLAQRPSSMPRIHPRHDTLPPGL